MASSNLQSKLSLSDRQKALRLPPELKQDHGDAIVMVSDDDIDLQNELLTMIFDVGDLDDGYPPNVVPWDESCIWVQNTFDNLDMSLAYFTLLFCIITDNLLNSRHFMDGALLSILEQKKETFIPVFKNRSEYERMKNNQDANKKLPGVYRIVKPVFLESNDSSRGRARRVTQLKKLFNHHLHTKLQRNDKQERDIIHALADMEDPVSVQEADLIDLDSNSSRVSVYTNQFSTDAQPPSIARSLSSSGYESLSRSESSNFKGGSSESIASHLLDHEMMQDDHSEGKLPLTEFQLKGEPTATEHLLTQGDMSIDAQALSANRTMIQATSSERNTVNTPITLKYKEHQSFQLDINCQNQQVDNLSSPDHQRLTINLNKNYEGSLKTPVEQGTEDVSDNNPQSITRNLTSQLSEDGEQSEDDSSCHKDSKIEASHSEGNQSQTQWRTAAAFGTVGVTAGLALGAAVALTFMKLK